MKVCKLDNFMCVGSAGEEETQNEAMAREAGKRHVNCQPRGWMEEDETGQKVRQITGPRQTGACLEKGCSSAITPFG